MHLERVKPLIAALLTVAALACGGAQELDPETAAADPVDETPSGSVPEVPAVATPDYPVPPDEPPADDSAALPEDALTSCVADGAKLVTTSSLNLRESAGSSADVIRVLPKGATVKANNASSGKVCASKGFYRVSYDGDTGFASGAYLTASLTPESACKNICGNCVYYARCLAPGLPSGLYTYNDKVKIINTHTARPGCVAIIKTSGSAGHVAFVRKVDGTTLTLNEANHGGHDCPTSRSGTESSLKITGYWCS